MIAHNAVHIAILMMAACLACASHNNAEPQETVKPGIVQGTVTIGPLRPGPVRIDQPEPEPPAKLFASHRIAVIEEDGKRTVTEAPLDLRGNYRVELPPGRYLIDFVPHDIGLRRPPLRPVTVESGKTVRLDLDIDTGMR